MNKSLLYTIIMLSLGLSSCGESGENESKNVTKEDTIVSAINEKDTLTSNEPFRNLIKSDDGILRGVQFNMSVEEVKKLEEGNQLEEETATQLDYMMNYASLEEAEVNYIFDKNKKLNAIELHVYPKNEESQDKVFSEFDNYFTKKIGPAVSSDATTRRWENKLEDLSVVLAKRGNQKIHDVNISITKIGAKPKA